MKHPGMPIGACLSTALLVACGSSSGLSPSMPTSGRAIIAQPVAGSASLPASSFGHLYVANAASVTVYAPNKTSVLRTISNVTPYALAFDGAGNLYVANEPSGGQADVVVYAHGSNSVLRTISTGVRTPHTLAVDAAGYLYVANGYVNVSIYEPGGVSPVRFIKCFYPASLAFNASDDVFVALAPGPYGGHKASVTVYTPGGKKTFRQISDGVSDPVALAIGTSGYLYVANYSNNVVDVYAPGSTKVLRTISQEISGPVAVALNAGYLYVANFVSSTVSVYAPGSQSPIRIIRDGVKHPVALAIDPSANLYVANSSNVTVYAPGSTTVLRTISSGIKSPSALGFGP
jgi:DNA-binding beta-propeller fold protein YncE